MTRSAALASRATLALLLVATVAHADDTADDHVARARGFHEKGDFVHARDELAAAYQLDARAELLFALGQVEFNLGHYQAAIDFYLKFMATNPAADESAPAEQALGAARIKLAQPPPDPIKPIPPPPPPPPPHRAWDRLDTALAGIGGLALVASAGTFYEGHHMSFDRSGTLLDYDRRLHTANELRLTSIACGIGGALAIGAALLRYQLRLVPTAIEVHPSTTGVVLTVEHPL